MNPEVESVNYYQNIFDNEFDFNSDIYTALINAGNGRSYYDSQYVIGSLNSIYLATNESAYIDQAISFAQIMIAKARIKDSQGYLNWPGKWTPSGFFTAPEPIASQLEDLQAGTELARLALILLANFPENEERLSIATLIKDFVETQIFRKHYFARNGQAWFLNNLGNTSRGVSDKTLMLFSILLNIQRYYAELKDNSSVPFQDEVSLLLSGLLSRFGKKERFEHIGNGAMMWDKGFSDEPGYGSEDTSHANRMPVLLLQLKKYGHPVEKYLKGVCELFKQNIWDGSYSDPMFNNFIDGANGPYLDRPSFGNGQIYTGWVRLAQVDLEIYKITDAVLSALRSGKRNPSLDYHRGIYGPLCLSAQLALAARTHHDLAKPVEPPPAPEPEPLTEPDPVPPPTFQQELEALVNKHSQEAGSNTPDFILAQFLVDCLQAFDRATNERKRWYKNPATTV